MPTPSIERFASTDDLAEWWASSRGLPIGVPGGIVGAQRALEIYLLAHPTLRPLRLDWRRMVRIWCDRTGGKDALLGLARRPNFWVDWLAHRGFMVGDLVPAATFQSWRADLMAVAYAWVTPFLTGGHQIWRRHGTHGFLRRPALKITRTSRGVLVDIVFPKRLAPQTVARDRAKKRRRQQSQPQKRKAQTKRAFTRIQAARALAPCRRLDGKVRATRGRD